MYQLHLYRSRVLARINRSYSGFEIIVFLTHSLTTSNIMRSHICSIGSPGIFRCHLLRNVILEHTDRASLSSPGECNLEVCPVLSLRVCKQAGLYLPRGVRSRVNRSVRCVKHLLNDFFLINRQPRCWRNIQ